LLILEGLQNTNVNGVVSEPFGKITDYSFNDTIPAGVTSIKIQNSYTEKINMNLFVVPSRSFINQPLNSGGGIGGPASYLVRAAVKSPRFPLFDRTKLISFRSCSLPLPPRVQP
jgi:hypothetical protein